MPEATNNSAIEDGSAGSSPPPSSQSQAGESAAAVDQSSGQAASERAPGESQNPEIDPLDAIYDELAAKGEQTKQSRSASPSKAEDTAGDDPSAAAAAEIPGQTTAAATNKDAGKQSQRQTAEYDGLTPDARGLLKSTNLLIPPAAWNEMPAIARDSLMESAKSIRAEKERLYQEKNQGTQAQQNQQQQQQQNPQAQGNQAQQATPQQIEAAFSELAKFGTDLAEPVKQIFTHQQQQFTGHLQTLTGQVKEQFDLSNAKIAFLLNRLERSEEHAAFEGDELKTLKALPEFANKEIREEIKASARALLRAQFSAGNRDFTLKEAIVQAARTHEKFFDKQQQAAQASLVESRSRSLRGTSARPAAVVPSVKATPKTESTVMDEVWDELYAKAGK